MVIGNDYKNVVLTELQSKTAQPGGRDRTTVKNETVPHVADKEKDVREKVQETATNISKIEKYLNRRIRLEIEDDLHIVVIKIIDKDSGEVIKQIPLEEAIEISRGIKELLAEKMKEQSGLLVDKEI